MRAAIIEDGVVKNIVKADPEFAQSQGWVVSDTAKVGDLYDGSGFTTPPPEPQSPEQIKERLRRAVEDHVEETARERDYSSAVSLASYTSSTKSDWAAEAQAFVKWRDDVWEYVFIRLAAVESGEEEPPESAEAFIQDLPVMVWPE